MLTNHQLSFLKDVFLCALASYGGPEAHYGVFSNQLVEKKGYISEEELTELIGLFSLVPGPSSSQTITAIGYHLGGPLLASLTLLVWIGPAILMMSLFGLWLSQGASSPVASSIISFLPATAVGFIVYGGILLSKKVLKQGQDWLFFLFYLVLAYLLIPISSVMVVLILLLAGYLGMRPARQKVKREWEQLKTSSIRPNWLWIGLIILLAILLAILSYIGDPLFQMLEAVYRYGYSIIGGGQVMIPLMIRDLVQGQGLVSQADFLSGYAIDQAVPGPLFSFAAFVTARAFSTSSWGLGIGLLGGSLIFLPGLFLVFFMTPLWQGLRHLKAIRYFLSGISVAVAALIVKTGIEQWLALPSLPLSSLILVLTAVLLWTRKIPAPVIIVLSMLAGYLFSSF